jgi:ankyrin repeat protein
LPDELLLHITDSLERDDIGSLLQTYTRLFYFLVDRYHLYDKYGQIPLIIASAMGHMKIIRRLLATGVDTATRNIFGQTALLAAATTGHRAAAHGRKSHTRPQERIRGGDGEAKTI